MSTVDLAARGDIFPAGVDKTKTAKRENIGLHHSSGGHKQLHINDDDAL